MDADPTIRHLTQASLHETINPEIMMAQAELNFRQHGGRRKGAGRPSGTRVAHSARPRFGRVLPVHVTLRVKPLVWNLRSGRSFRRIAACFAKARGRFGMRLIQFSVQGNHLHLIVEADDTESLTRGMQGLAVRIARTLNAMMRRAGKLFADHYHARLLRSPTELVNAIRYVLGNAAHHFGHEDRRYSSSSLTPAQRDELLAAPRGWLLLDGVRRTSLGVDAA